jgi:hypothetical protein
VRLIAFILLLWLFWLLCNMRRTVVVLSGGAGNGTSVNPFDAVSGIAIDPTETTTADKGCCC